MLNVQCKVYNFANENGQQNSAVASSHEVSKSQAHGTLLMVSWTHTIPISLGIPDWEWYGYSMGKGFHSWEVPENPTEVAWEIFHKNWEICRKGESCQSFVFNSSRGGSTFPRGVANRHTSSATFFVKRLNS